MDRNYKSLDIRETGAPGTFSGWASRYNEEDSYRDVVLPGAYDRTVREHNGEIVILADHNPDKSIGLAKMTLRPEGLWIDARLALELTDARDAYVRMRDLKKSGLSIGYSVPPGGERYRKNGVRELLDITLFEISSVQFPALDSARIASVKRHTGGADLGTSLDRLAATIREAKHRVQATHTPDPAIAVLEVEFRKLNNAVKRYGPDDPDVLAFASHLQAKLDDVKAERSVAALLASIQDLNRDLTR